MPVVAVAGGTGGIGRAIVEGILATGKYEVKVLSRRRNPELEALIGVTILATDYHNVGALTQVLEDHNVHTVISALTFSSPEGVPPELQLVLAADASKTTKRYIANNWGVPLTEEYESLMGSMAFKVECLKALKEAKDLTYTGFYNGVFLDYWGMPTVTSFMKPTIMVLDIANAAAAIPGSGNTPIAFTHTSDIAKYVAAVLDLDTWEPGYNISADKVTWNEFLALAERVRGTKFDVAYDDLEKLKAGHVTELPAQVSANRYRKLLAAVYLLMESGAFDIKDGTDAKEVFPGIKPKTVGSLLEEAWKKA